MMKVEMVLHVLYFIALCARPVRTSVLTAAFEKDAAVQGWVGVCDGDPLGGRTRSLVQCAALCKQRGSCVGFIVQRDKTSVSCALVQQDGSCLTSVGSLGNDPAAWPRAVGYRAKVVLIPAPSPTAQQWTITQASALCKADAIFSDWANENVFVLNSGEVYRYNRPEDLIVGHEAMFDVSYMFPGWNATEVTAAYYYEEQSEDYVYLISGSLVYKYWWEDRDDPLVFDSLYVLDTICQGVPADYVDILHTPATDELDIVKGSLLYQCRNRSVVWTEQIASVGTAFEMGTDDVTPPIEHPVAGEWTKADKAVFVNRNNTVVRYEKSKGSLKWEKLGDLTCDPEP